MSLTGNHHDRRAQNNQISGRSGCYYCVKAVKWIPVLFIVAIIMWSYYAYAIQLSFCKLKKKFSSIFHVSTNHAGSIEKIVHCYPLKFLLYSYNRECGTKNFISPYVPCSFYNVLLVVLANDFHRYRNSSVKGECVDFILFFTFNFELESNVMSDRYDKNF